jgi:hypothetical protein
VEPEIQTHQTGDKKDTDYPDDYQGRCPLSENPHNELIPPKTRRIGEEADEVKFCKSSRTPTVILLFSLPSVFLLIAGLPPPHETQLTHYHMEIKE